MKPGIYQISSEEYHASEGLSRSQLMHFRRSPKHFYAHCVEKSIPREETKSLKIGRALHTMILEPDLFLQEYTIADTGGNSNAAKSKALEIKASGKTAISFKEYEQLKALKNSSGLAELIKYCDVEQSIYWMNEEFNVLLKCRPDIMVVENEISFVMDLKSAIDASHNAIQNAAYQHGYFMQAAMIQDAILATKEVKVSDFRCLVIEKTEPYVTACYQIPAEAIEFSREEYLRYVATYANCMKNNEWPGYPEKEITIPQYAYYN